MRVGSAATSTPAKPGRTLIQREPLTRSPSSGIASSVVTIGAHGQRPALAAGGDPAYEVHAADRETAADDDQAAEKQDLPDRDRDHQPLVARVVQREQGVSERAEQDSPANMIAHRWIIPKSHMLRSKRCFMRDRPLCNVSRR